MFILMFQAPYDMNVAVIAHSENRETLEKLRTDIIRTFSDDNVPESFDETTPYQDVKKPYISEEMYKHIMEVAEHWTWDGVDDQTVIIEESSLELH